MDLKQIQELIKMVNKSNIGELTVEQKDIKITIKQKEEKITQVISAPTPSLPTAFQNTPQQITATTTISTEEKTVAVASNLVTIKSPMIGTFYKKQGPGKPDFVSLGDDVTPGKVVCIIEAMKLFNEIECEIKGKIVKILVEDATPVEYDQPLFLVEPN